MARTSIRQRRGGSRGGTGWRHGRWRARPGRTCRLASLAGALWRALALVALHRADHALAVGRNATVVDVARPRVDHVGSRIDVLGVAGAERDRVAAVKVLRAFV